jgi:hypothetical protein
LREDFQPVEAYIDYDYKRYEHIAKEDAVTILSKSGINEQLVNNNLDRVLADTPYVVSVLSNEKFNKAASEGGMFGGDDDEGATESNLYRVFWLSNFRNRTKVSIDQYLYAVGMYVQVQQPTSEKSFDIKGFYDKLTNFIIAENYEVDLETDGGVNILKYTINAITNKSDEALGSDEAGQAVTVKAEGSL